MTLSLSWKLPVTSVNNNTTLSVCLSVSQHQSSPSVWPHNLATRFRPPSATLVSAKPFSHGTGTLRCLQKEMVTYRHWFVSLWRDRDNVPHCWILHLDKTEWRLISATLCGWRRCFVADQLWLMTRIREEKQHQSTVLSTALTALHRHHASSRNKLYITLPNNQSRIWLHLRYMMWCHHISPALPAALVPCAAVCCVQDCDSHLYWSLSSNALGYLADDCLLVADARVRQCVLLTLEHLLSVGRAAVLETGPLPLQDHKSGTVCRPSQTMWSVIRPLQAVTEDIFIWIVWTVI